MLELELDSLDGLDESLKSFYEEKEEGIFRLSVNGLDDAIAGKGTLIKEREARRLANEKLAAIEAERQEAERKRQEAEQEALKEKGEFQTLYNNEQEKAKKANEQYETLLKTIANDKIDSTAVRIAASIGIDEPSQELLTEQARKFVVYEDGKTVYKIGGVEVDKDTVIKTLSDKYPRLVKGSGAGGAGAMGSNKGGSLSNNPFKKGEHYNLTEQGRLMRENPTLANQMMKEA